MKDLFRAARDCLIEADIDSKINLSSSIVSQYTAGNLSLVNDTYPPEIFRPGLPSKLKLVSAKFLPRRSFSTAVGKAAMLHALAHIEFNAINIAWDAVYRFRNMPEEYYRDWVKIADEETRHFCLLRQHLQERNYDYGDFDGHDGLWRMVERTAGNPLERMAIVPRVYEARGLDVTPDIIRKFEEVGEEEIARSMNIIYEDEIGHVAIGNHWFRYLCDKQGLEPGATFIELIRKYMDNVPRIKLNHEARLMAGFTQDELTSLESEFA